MKSRQALVPLHFRNQHYSKVNPKKKKHEPHVCPYHSKSRIRMQTQPQKNSKSIPTLNKKEFHSPKIKPILLNSHQINSRISSQIGHNDHDNHDTSRLNFQESSVDLIIKSSKMKERVHLINSNQRQELMNNLFDDNEEEDTDSDEIKTYVNNRLQAIYKQEQEEASQQRYQKWNSKISKRKQILEKIQREKYKLLMRLYQEEVKQVKQQQKSLEMQTHNIKLKLPAINLRKNL